MNGPEDLLLVKNLATTLRGIAPDTSNFVIQRKGTIVSVQPGTPTTCTITLSGDSTQISGVHFARGYTPAVGDIVNINKQGGSLLILGTNRNTAGPDILNIKAFGAKGDGTTNDTAAFTNAGTTYPVYIPAGTYVCSTAPAGWYFGVGSIKVGSETFPLDKSTAQQVNRQLVGDGIKRNDTVVGQGAGAALSSGSATTGANAAFGHNALKASVSGARNTALGAGTLANATNTDLTVAVGTDAMYGSVYSDRNTFSGTNAGKWTGDSDPLTHGHDFFTNGANTLYSIDARWPNLRTDIVGAAGSPSNVASSTSHNTSNVGVGRNSLLHAVRSWDNVAVGYNSLAHGYNVFGSTAVGSGALRDGITANDCVAVGNAALQKNASGSGNVAVGAGAATNLTHTRYNVAVGWQAMGNFSDSITAPDGSLTVVDGTASAARKNIAVGHEAMYAASDTSGSFRFNVGVGSQALYNVSGPANVAVGGVALQNCTSGSLNVGIGHEGLGQITTGTENTAIGYQAGKLLQSGSNAQTVTNTSCVGSGSRISGSNQVQLGDSATTTYVYGTVQNRSDLRDKADVRDTVLGLDFINRLRPVDYRWDMREDYPNQEPDGTQKRNRYHHGLIAQDVEEVIQTTGVDFGGYQDHTLNDGCDVKTLGYDELIAPLIKAVQELSAEVQYLRGQLNSPS